MKLINIIYSTKNRFFLSHIPNPTSKIQHRSIFHPTSKIQHQTSNIQKAGTTVIELMTAITIMLIISSMIFAAYLTIFKEFNFFTRKSDKVMTAIITKKKVDAILEEIGTVTGAYKTSLEYLDIENNKEHSLTYRSNALYRDNIVQVKDLKSFSYIVPEEQSYNGRKLLLWEAVLLNDYWIGGAREVVQR